MRSKDKGSISAMGQTPELRPKQEVRAPAKSIRSNTRCAARLACLEDDPLDFWDYGMLYAFDVAEAQLLDLLSQGKVLTAKTVLQVFSKERETVYSEELHSFYLPNGVAAEPAVLPVRDPKPRKTSNKTHVTTRIRSQSASAGSAD